MPTALFSDTPGNNRIQAALVTMETSGLVSLAQTLPELEYMFRHALVQETAYDSLLKSERSQLHRAIGQVLEEAFPGQHPELAAVIARHYDLAGEAGKAVTYYLTAGEAALSAFAHAEAMALMGRAEALARTHAWRQQQVRCLIGLGRACDASGLTDTGLAYLNLALSLEDDPQVCADIYHHITLIYRIHQSDFAQAVACSEQALAALGQQENVATARALIDLSHDLSMMDPDTRRPLELLERARGILETLDAPADLAWCYANLAAIQALDQPRLGIEYGQRAVELLVDWFAKS